ncbi:permease [Bradyrhizobium sp. BRP22]|uniref:permease n=1 Tax=Bradyrhizobium sp. BRP22 TaxID=2793821 RepID=UPI001CD2E541|nr:permease [Bradyrhizobium sp. BRP22]MCA1452392.1 permease [Bradyrhizobium sp. BRP22]
MDREIEIRKRRGTRVLLTVLAIWGLAVAVAAEAGLYGAIYPLLLGPIIVLGIVVPVAIYAVSDGFRSYVEAIGLRPLTAFQIWRIGAALVIFWYGAHNLLPQSFVQNAGWGDLITGFLALGVILLPESRNRYLAVHIFGFADLVVAVGTGLTFFLLNDPRMSGIQTLPMALIPLYGVGISGASHIMAFDLLRRGAGIKHAERDAAKA